MSGAPSRYNVKNALEDWLKEIRAARTLRIFVKERTQADAHHTRILTELEKKEERERHTRMIAKQRDANKRLRRAYVEGCNVRTGEERKRVRARIVKRGIAYSGKRPIMEGKRAARGKAAGSRRV